MGWGGGGWRNGGRGEGSGDAHLKSQIRTWLCTARKKTLTPIRKVNRSAFGSSSTCQCSFLRSLVLHNDTAECMVPPRQVGKPRPPAPTPGSIAACMTVQHHALQMAKQLCCLICDACQLLVRVGWDQKVIIYRSITSGGLHQFGVGAFSCHDLPFFVIHGTCDSYIYTYTCLQLGLSLSLSLSLYIYIYIYI